MTSFSAFARAHGISPQAVSKAVRAGRFAEALVEEDVAAREWAENRSRVPTVTRGDAKAEAPPRQATRRAANEAHATGATTKIPVLDADQLAAFWSQELVWIAVLRFDGDLDRDWLFALRPETARQLAAKLLNLCDERRDLFDRRDQAPAAPGGSK
jgi:hypothetical protein